MPSPATHRLAVGDNRGKSATKLVFDFLFLDDARPQPTRRTHAMLQIASLNVKPAAEYIGNFPKMSQPKEVACYSRDGARAVRYDKSALRPYRPPKLPAVLNEGFKQYIPKQSDANEPAPLGDILGALAHKNVPTKDAQVITYRNNLNKIFLTPYQRREDWEVGVEKREDGVVMLHVRDTPRKLAEEAKRDERQQRMAYWGYRFEQLATLSEREAAALGSGSGAAATGDGDGGYRVPSPSDQGAHSLARQILVRRLHHIAHQTSHPASSLILSSRSQPSPCACLSISTLALATLALALALRLVRSPLPSA